MNAQSSDAAEAFTQAMIADPGCYPDLPLTVGFTLTQEQRDRIALAGLRKRFDELRGKLPVLDNMAAEQGVDEIDEIDRAALLLFPHTVYKSYPLSIIERGQYDRLTRWLQGLVVVDLKGFDARGVDTIDGWIDALDAQCGVQLVHTSGTTGKISFLPRLTSDAYPRLKLHTTLNRDWNGLNAGPDLLAQPRPLIYPSYRSGSTAPLRSIGMMAKHVARTEDNFLSLYPDHFSADVVSLAGRLRTAEERGEQGRMQLPASLLARREEFIRRERERPQAMERFFAEAQERFAGRDIMVLGVLPFIYDWAEAGLSRGMRGQFGPGTVLQLGGGSKGRELPANAREMIAEFLGIDRCPVSYGMSEMSGTFRGCAQGNYHIPPFVAPLVVDPATGAVLPRRGRQTGRFGFVDIFPADHWGGFLSGDKVTIAGWDEPCACGRTGPHLEGLIQRFSELEGGDDKITCAGAPAAHDKAIEYLASIIE